MPNIELVYRNVSIAANDLGLEGCIRPWVEIVVMQQEAQDIAERHEQEEMQRAVAIIERFNRRCKLIDDLKRQCGVR